MGRRAKSAHSQGADHENVPISSGKSAGAPNERTKRDSESYIQQHPLQSRQGRPHGASAFISELQAQQQLHRQHAVLGEVELRCMVPRAGASSAHQLYQANNAVSALLMSR